METRAGTSLGALAYHNGDTGGECSCGHQWRLRIYVAVTLQSQSKEQRFVNQRDPVRNSYIICRAQCKMKMQYTLIKNY